MTVWSAARPNPLSSTGEVLLDEVDRQILDALVEDARLPNNTLAARVGVAPSTCSLRVKRLVSAGVIRGFHADLAPEALGLPLQAMIAVRMSASARADIGAVAPRLAALPGVLNVYFLSGGDDFLIQVAAASPDALREFVTRHLSASREFASTETSLVFDHVRGASERLAPSGRQDGAALHVPAPEPPRDRGRQATSVRAPDR
ncbi:Lrp/AsnC family transcriptional regulator [Blastococcus sp. VKM Ac-2987]|uniref:Lrp/AsnC family transcriptional regulator n=1 Tax=Blastococcus sp. VKM Ac-2987 TaxID=3004141 RepID=UPI0022ABB76B|nr:Lrp/AsnC family transcriptional regulator [Blastococcus sp. VKM Ac-2987]MCZ2860304.1 Lrp/AsnC family transcriptional regulator [Blastococcus sp. VKM Ac-2987]